MGAAERIPERDLVPKVLATYGVEASSAIDQNRFVTEHISQLESSENETIARTGFVLKHANEGFGLGYKVPLAIIAMGQAMLGLDLAVATPFLASNPAAFTAAALGAVYYGYQSLNDDERAELHSRIGTAIDYGVELVKTIIAFCIDTMKSLMDSKAFTQMRKYVAEAAEAAGITLYDVTGKFVDRVSGIASSASSSAASVSEAFGSTASSTYDQGKKFLWRDRSDDK